MAASEGEILLINNNNTRTKFALADSGGIIAHESLLSRELSVEGIRELLHQWLYKSVIFASVVPDNVPTLIESQAGLPLIELTCEIELGVAIDFPDPSTVGADRLANAAAVAGRFPGEAVVVVDFGTAVTFDIIDARPAYIGGVIAPGLDAMRHYLQERTALLPEIELQRPDSAIGRTTEHAMQSGAFHGYRGLVVEILKQIESELKVTPKVIATGGYAGLIADALPGIDEIAPLLTMEGLLKIARLNTPE